MKFAAVDGCFDARGGSLPRKAEKCVSDAKISWEVGLNNDAGRGAYLAAFHAAQALIFERTGKAADE